MRVFRRHWLQLAALTLVAGALVVLWLVGGRSGSSASGGGGAGGTSVSGKATPSPTEDPRIEQVREAARAYVQALDTALQTGSPAGADALTVDGSQARGLAGNPAAIARGTHKTFVVTERAYQSLDVHVLTTAATAIVSYDDHGYDAAWPSLQRAGPDRVLHVDETLGFQLVVGRWLVDTER